LQEEYIYTQSDLDSYTREAVLIAEEEERRNTLDELKQMMSAGDSTVSVLRTLFPEDVVVFADGGYSFFPIQENLKKHEYVYDNFVTQDNKEIVYLNGADTVLSTKGIDVSKHQGEIDWEKVSEDGVTYAFIRAGFRGNSEGKLVEDEYFADNMEGASRNDIHTGVYFYTQAITPEEAKEEAEFVLDLIEPYDVTYPIVLDLEETGSDSARTAEMTKEEYTETAIAFCETIKEAGYTPMIYGNLKTFMIMLDMEQIEEYDKWFAYYDSTVYFPYDFAIWQYSSKGRVAGIKGDVDLNVGMKDYAKDSE
ncbi:MAG: glycoside hydrolase family 25 protein, partial [Lachnospiraceae bacterium]|nr:glycoside hydrolase family 25 protein [Lachnospiraceae bacterium]